MRVAFAAFKMAVFLFMCLGVIVAQGIVLLFHTGRYARIVPYFWMNAVCFIFNIKVRVSGVPSTDGQIVYVSNHMSYLDIPVIGSILKSRFVSRKDAGEWPLFGALVKLGQTAFVQRSRSAVKGDAGAVSAVLDAGNSLIVFPEGTSTDGRDVLPFKSSLFSLFVREDLPDLQIQPITLRVLRANGDVPETQEQRDIYAWHKDLDTPFFVHLWLFAQRGGAEILVTFHDQFAANAYSDRKTLAKACHETVSQEHQNLVTQHSP